MVFRNARTVFALIASLILPELAYAQGSWIQSEKLVAPDAASGDVLASLAMSDDWIVAGAMREDPSGMTDAGSVYVFAWNTVNSSWEFHQKLVAPDLGAGDNFGAGVAVEGDYIVVGASQDDHSGGTNAGSAYVFVWNPSTSTWDYQQKLLAFDAAADDEFGSSVGVDQDTIVVGAPDDDHPLGNGDAGAAYVFVWNTVTLSWDFEQKLTRSNSAPGDSLAQNVDIEGNRIVAGATGFIPPGVTYDTGAAYVFRRSAGVWTQEAELVAGDAASGDYFGWSVGLSGDSVVVSAPEDDHAAGSGAGSAYVFRRTGTNWTEEAKLIACDAEASEELGERVAIHGNRVVATSIRADVLGQPWAGCAYVFTRSGTTWQPTARLAARDAGADDHLGLVTLSPDWVVLGAIFDDHSGFVDAGSLYTFRRATIGTPFCFGDGSGAGCPCGNGGCPSEGCANTNTQGAALVAAGSASVMVDKLTFHATNLLPSSPALLFVGNSAVSGGNGISFGDGLRCVGTNTYRLGAKVPTSGGYATWGPGLGALPGWSAGDTRRFQIWYRDPGGPCGSGFNLTNAVEVTFTP